MESRHPCLKDRTAFITGAARGLGRGIAHRLAREGATVVVADVQEAMAAAAAQAIEDEGGKAIPVGIDVADPDSVQRAVDEIVRRTGRLDVLVNNAALLQDIDRRPFWELSVYDWRRVIDVNLGGAYLCARASAGIMIRSGWGRIVNISSSSAVNGRPNCLHYVSSKAGLIGMTRSMAREIGAMGVTVNAVLPGLTRTEVDRGPDKEREFERVAREQSIRRTAGVDDHAGLVAWLCSDEAGYVTGQCFLSDGGRGFL